MSTAATARVGAAPRPYAIPGPFALLLAGFAALHLAMLGHDLEHPSLFLAAPGGHTPAQAMLYAVDGALPVIAVQVLLALASLLWVREIGLRLGLPEGKAGAAALLYGLLPHTLVLPHQLAAEAIFAPLAVLSFVLVLRGASVPRHAAAGLAMGVAALVRPLMVVWPLVHALFARRARPAARFAYLAAGLAPFALWTTFVFSHAQQFALGRSLEEYAQFVLSRPEPALAEAARRVQGLALDPGVERLVAGYLELPAAPAFAAPATTALYALLAALALLGSYVFVRTGRWMLVVFLPCALAAGAPAAAQFALCLLAVTGFWALQRREPPRRRATYERVEPTLDGR